MPTVNPQEWDAFLATQSNPHVLQTRPWGELKSRFGWRVRRLKVGGCGVQILFRPIALGFTLAYIPRGPVGPRAAWERLWPEVDRVCRDQRALFLKVEPDLWEGETRDDDVPEGFTVSAHTIQPPRTILVSLEGEPEEWLRRMKQKTRYNIRLAGRKDVVVAPGADVDLFYELMKTTGERDGFGVHSREYYHSAYELFKPSGSCELFLARYQEQPLAALMVFASAGRAWYFYGASGEAHRERMPAYLLQWKAMLWARGRGCTEYDLYGVPDEEESRLEEQFSTRSDGLWGVYRFKRGFGGRVMRSTGAWDRVYNRLGYSLYTFWSGRRREAV